MKINRLKLKKLFFWTLHKNRIIKIVIGSIIINSFSELLMSINFLILTAYYCILLFLISKSVCEVWIIFFLIFFFDFYIYFLSDLESKFLLSFLLLGSPIFYLLFRIQQILFCGKNYNLFYSITLLSPFFISKCKGQISERLVDQS